MIHESDATKALDARRKRLNRHGVARKGDRDVGDDLATEVLELHRSRQDLLRDAGVLGDTLGQEVGRALGMSHFVRGDQTQHVLKNRLFGL